MTLLLATYRGRQAAYLLKTLLNVKTPDPQKSFSSLQFLAAMTSFLEDVLVSYFTYSDKFLRAKIKVPPKLEKNHKLSLFHYETALSFC